MHKRSIVIAVVLIAATAGIFWTRHTIDTTGKESALADRAVALVEEALAYQTEGRVDLAIQNLDQAVAIDPQNGAPRLHRAELRRKLQDFEGAVEDYSVYLRGNPDQRLYLARASAYLDLRQYRLAMADADHVINSHPDNPRGFGTRGMVRAAMGEFDEAIADFSRAIEMNPGEPQPWINRARIMLKRGQHQAALKDLSEAIKHVPGNGELFGIRANVYRAMKKLDQAEADLTSAIENSVNPAIYLVLRGKLHGQLDRNERGIDDLNTAIELSPMAEFYFERAVLKAKAKRFEQSIFDWTRAIELRPGYAAALYRRGQTYDQMGMTERAVADYRAAVAIDPAFKERVPPSVLQ